MKKDIKNANGKIIGYIEEDSGGMSIHSCCISDRTVPN